MKPRSASSKSVASLVGRQELAPLWTWLASAGWSVASARLTPLGDGPYCCHYRLSVGGAQFMVQWRKKDARRLEGSARAQSCYQRLAWQAGLAPEPVFEAVGAGVYVSRWVSGTHPDSSPALEQMSRIGQAIGRLHRIAVIGSSPPLDLAAHLEGYFRSLAGVEQRRLAACHRDRLIELAWLDDGARALCHHDLHRHNIFFDEDGAVRFCDWEYAAIGQPAFDLAMCAEYFALDAPQQQALLQGYRQAGGQVPETAAMRQWRRLCGYCNRLWQQAERGTSVSAAAGGTADKNQP